MTLSDFQQLYTHHPQVYALVNWAESLEQNLKISGLSGSSSSLVIASLFKANPQTHIIVRDDADDAAYLYNDLKQVLGAEEVFFFPSTQFLSQVHTRYHSWMLPMIFCELKC